LDFVSMPTVALHSESASAVFTVDAVRLFPTPPDARLRLSIILPVRNEAEGLERTLASLAAQTETHGRPLDPRDYETLVLANNCTDGTTEIARRFASRHPEFRLSVAEVTLPSAEANIGTARRLLMDEACQRFLERDKLGGVIASTDGDTRVAPDWVAQTLLEFERGADAVGGRVFTEPGGDPAARRYQLRDIAYLHGLSRLEAILDTDSADPWPRHHQLFGASLAVTAEMYARVDGLPRVSHLEDEALARALRRIDARIRHSPHVRVWTSARQEGRVECGLSSTLRIWGGMGRSGARQIVEQPAAIETRLRSRAQLRQLWEHASSGHHGDCHAIASLADTLAVPVSLLQEGLAPWGQYFGVLWDAVEQQHRRDDGLWAQRWPRQDITEALPALRERLRHLKR
jgi:GT2 family glycosyltransferase